MPSAMLPVGAEKVEIDDDADDDIVGEGGDNRVLDIEEDREPELVLLSYAIPGREAECRSGRRRTGRVGIRGDDTATATVGRDPAVDVDAMDRLE